MMPGVKYVIYGCSSARTTPRVSLSQSLTLEENIIYYSYCTSQGDRWQFEKAN